MQRFEQAKDSISQKDFLQVLAENTLQIILEKSTPY